MNDLGMSETSTRTHASTTSSSLSSTTSTTSSGVSGVSMGHSPPPSPERMVRVNEAVAPVLKPDQPSYLVDTSTMTTTSLAPSQTSGTSEPLLEQEDASTKKTQRALNSVFQFTPPPLQSADGAPHVMEGIHTPLSVSTQTPDRSPTSSPRPSPDLSPQASPHLSPHNLTVDTLTPRSAIIHTPTSASDAVDKYWWDELTRLTPVMSADSLLPYSRVTHRYENIRCVRSTSEGLFFHANFMKYPPESENVPTFIAAQYPQERARDGAVARELFWLSALDNGSIIDLTQKNEPGTSVYYPIEVGNKHSLTYRYVRITCTNKFYIAENIEKCFYNVETPSKEKQVVRIHFFGWQDKKPLDSLPQLTQLIDILKGLFEQNPEEKPCVHCKAGVGRTGTLIASFYLDKLIRKGLVTFLSLPPIATTIVRALRTQRNSEFVQDYAQFQQILRYGEKTLREFLQSTASHQEKTPSLHAGETKEEKGPST